VYRQLKEAMDALYERSVTIHDTDPASGHTRVKKTRWVSEAAYVDGAGNVQVIFTPEVIKYVTRLEAEFTSYQLEKVGHMTSAHAVRIYELLAQHKDIGSRTLNLAWLRTLQIEPGRVQADGRFQEVGHRGGRRPDQQAQRPDGELQAGRRAAPSPTSRSRSRTRSARRRPPALRPIRHTAQAGSRGQQRIPEDERSFDAIQL
jgi:hypothetical protein